ncbi:hypothetical protein AK812_SmicGene13463 [Symbiodinium microadriaticum]|uniref:Uncharacterized protein n=1 Tax=Symbiodinium microadriaticum TaxID=2951 RepID=A0A1Q9E850_SYMMI|nr:hypothetical protein AK812_SmicGene13463 [Symbiodinium microadriaticum]
MGADVSFFTQVAAELTPDREGIELDDDQRHFKQVIDNWPGSEILVNSQLEDFPLPIQPVGPTLRCGVAVCDSVTGSDEAEEEVEEPYMMYSDDLFVYCKNEAIALRGLHDYPVISGYILEADTQPSRLSINWCAMLQVLVVIIAAIRCRCRGVVVVMGVVIVVHGIVGVSVLVVDVLHYGYSDGFLWKSLSAVLRSCEQWMRYRFRVEGFSSMDACFVVTHSVDTTAIWRLDRLWQVAEAAALGHKKEPAPQPCSAMRAMSSLPADCGMQGRAVAEEFGRPSRPPRMYPIRRDKAQASVAIVGEYLPGYVPSEWHGFALVAERRSPKYRPDDCNGGVVLKMDSSGLLVLTVARGADIDVYAIVPHTLDVVPVTVDGLDSCLELVFPEDRASRVSDSQALSWALVAVRSYTGDEVQENKDSPFGAQSVARHRVKLRRIADHWHQSLLKTVHAAFSRHPHVLMAQARLAHNRRQKRKSFCPCSNFLSLFGTMAVMAEASKLQKLWRPGLDTSRSNITWQHAVRLPDGFQRPISKAGIGHHQIRTPRGASLLSTNSGRGGLARQISSRGTATPVSPNRVQVSRLGIRQGVRTSDKQRPLASQGALLAQPGGHVSASKTVRRDVKPLLKAATSEGIRLRSRSVSSENVDHRGQVTQHRQLRPASRPRGVVPVNQPRLQGESNSAGGASAGSNFNGQPQLHGTSLRAPLAAVCLFESLAGGALMLECKEAEFCQLLAEVRRQAEGCDPGASLNSTDIVFVLKRSAGQTPSFSAQTVRSASLLRLKVTAPFRCWAFATLEEAKVAAELTPDREGIELDDDQRHFKQVIDNWPGSEILVNSQLEDFPLPIQPVGPTLRCGVAVCDSVTGSDEAEEEVEEPYMMYSDDLFVYCKNEAIALRGLHDYPVISGYILEADTQPSRLSINWCAMLQVLVVIIAAIRCRCRGVVVVMGVVIVVHGIVGVSVLVVDVLHYGYSDGFLWKSLSAVLRSCEQWMRYRFRVEGFSSMDACFVVTHSVDTTAIWRLDRLWQVAEAAALGHEKECRAELWLKRAEGMYPIRRDKAQENMAIVGEYLPGQYSLHQHTERNWVFSSRDIDVYAIVPHTLDVVPVTVDGTFSAILGSGMRDVSQKLAPQRSAAYSTTNFEQDCTWSRRSYTGDEVQENKDSPFGAQSVARPPSSKSSGVLGSTPPGQTSPGSTPFGSQTVFRGPADLFSQLEPISKAGIGHHQIRTPRGASLLSTNSGRGGLARQISSRGTATPVSPNRVQVSRLGIRQGVRTSDKQRPLASQGALLAQPGGHVSASKTVRRDVKPLLKAATSEGVRLRSRLVSSLNVDRRSQVTQRRQLWPASRPRGVVPANQPRLQGDSNSAGDASAGVQSTEPWTGANFHGQPQLHGTSLRALLAGLPQLSSAVAGRNLVGWRHSRSSFATAATAYPSAGVSDLLRPGSGDTKKSTQCLPQS